MAKVTMLVTVNCREANRPGGTSGWSLRRSTHDEGDQREHAEPAPATTTAGSSPLLPAGDGRVREPGEPDRAEHGAGQVEPAAGGRVHATPARAGPRPATTTAASGRLIRKTSRQDHASTSQPPRNGPTAPAMPPSPDQAPIARPRSAGTNDAEMMARLPGVSSAPPTPCRARAATSVSDVRGEAAQRRGEREPDGADDEDPPPAEPVGQRAAEQDERGQRQRVARSASTAARRDRRPGPRRSGAARR